MKEVASRMAREHWERCAGIPLDKHPKIFFYVEEE
jgi:hypothetical protein